MTSNTREAGELSGRHQLIPVSPAPASRPRVPRFGKPYYEGRYKTFREDFGTWLHRVALPAPLPKPATFTLTIRVAVDRPKKPTNTYPRGDVDNYAKSVMDQLQGKGWFADDVQVTSLFVTKGYAEPGVPGHIHIYIERND